MKDGTGLSYRRACLLIMNLQIAKLFAEQFGVITRDQARAAGMKARAIDRRLESGEWTRVFQGVYRLTSSPRIWHQALLGASFWAGPGSAIALRAAAALLEFDGFKPGPVELVGESRRVSPAGVRFHHTSQLLDADVMDLRPFRVTNATRLLLDFAAILDEERLGQLLDESLRRRLTSIPRLRWRLLQAVDHKPRGMSKLLKLIEDRELGVPESVLEARFLRLLKKSRLPQPKRQFEIRSSNRLIARVDFAYPQIKLAIETDGYRYHSGKSAWGNDLKRRNALTAFGWTLFHITSDDLSKRARETADLVRRSIVQCTENVEKRRSR